MANNTEKKPDVVVEVQPIKPKKHSFLAGFAALTSIAAIGLSGYTLQTNLQEKKHFLQENSELAAQVDQIKQDQTRIQSLANTHASNIQQTQALVDEKINRVLAQVQTAQRESNNKSDDWMLMKARYYIELAQINTHWTNDAKSSIGLLQQADTLLQQLNDAKLFALRQTIAKDIATLNQIATIDEAGILSQLDAAAKSVDALSIPAMNTNLQSNTDTKDQTNPGWRGHLKDSVNLLEKLVVVRRNDEDVKPLLSPMYESILKESVRLHLQEAQWAVLNKNQAVYDLALKQAMDTLNRAFNTKMQNTAALIDQLKVLGQIKLLQDKPEIGSGLPLLNQVIDSMIVSTKSLQAAKKGDKPS